MNKKKSKKISFLFSIITLTACLAGCNSSVTEETFIVEDEAETITYNEVEKFEYWTISKNKSISTHEEETSEDTTEALLFQAKNTLENMEKVVNISKTMESSNFSKMGISNKIAEKRELTDEEKNEILKQIDECTVTNKESLYDLIYLIDSNIASFDQRERDLMVKKYMLSLYSLMNKMNSVLEVVGYDLENAVNEYNININDKISIETLPDTYGTVKGFLLEVKEKGFFVNSNGENEGFYLDLDLGNMIDKYNSFISSSMVKYMEFNNYEMNNILSDYNIEEIANRIKMLESGMRIDRHSNYVITDRYISSITYYYQILLGLSHNHFTGTNDRFKQSVLDEYVELNASETTKDILNKMTLAIQTNDMIYDDEVKELVYDYMNSKIYSDEIIGVFDNKNTYKYELVSEEDLKPIIPEKEEEEEIEIETETEEEGESKPIITNIPENQNTESTETTNTENIENTDIQTQETGETEEPVIPENEIQVVETEIQ